jgi:hypothetical protein
VRKRPLRYRVVATKTNPWVIGPNETIAVVAACRTLDEAKLRLDEATADFPWLVIVDGHTGNFVRVPGSGADATDPP